MSWSGYIPGHLVNHPKFQEAVARSTSGVGLTPIERGEESTVIMQDAVPDIFPAPEPFRPEPPRGDLRWIAVDLDGTLAEGVWTPDNPTSDIGEVKVYADGKTGRDKAIELVEAGYHIIVHTSRSWTDYENIKLWMRHHEIPFKAIVCGKLLVKEYVDDRGISAFESSWLPERNVRA